MAKDITKIYSLWKYVMTRILAGKTMRQIHRELRGEVNYLTILAIRDNLIKAGVIKPEECPRRWTKKSAEC